MSKIVDKTRLKQNRTEQNWIDHSRIELDRMEYIETEKSRIDQNIRIENDRAE